MNLCKRQTSQRTKKMDIALDFSQVNSFCEHGVVPTVEFLSHQSCESHFRRLVRTLLWLVVCVLLNFATWNNFGCPYHLTFHERS